MSKSKKFLLMAASIAGLTFAATSASADGYSGHGYYERDGYRDSYYDRGAYNDGYYNNTESVIVVGPRYQPRERAANGRTIRTVTASKGVSYYDLDLRTYRGAEQLRNRIKSTARNLCDRLDFMHPVTAKDSPPCYKNAVREAMIDADYAIARARGG